MLRMCAENSARGWKIVMSLKMKNDFLTLPPEDETSRVEGLFYSVFASISSVKHIPGYVTGQLGMRGMNAVITLIIFRGL